MTLRTRSMIFSAFLMLLSTGMAIWFLAFELPRMEAIMGPGGRVATGILLDKREKVTNNRHDLVASIQFSDAAGTTHVFENSFPQEAWDNLQPGKPVELRYLVSDPDFCYALTSYKATRNPMVILLAFGVMFVVGAVVWLLMRNSRR